MNAEYLAQAFQEIRKKKVNQISHRMNVNEDLVDMLYTDLWPVVLRNNALQPIRDLGAYMTVTLSNAVKMHLRDSHDLLDRPGLISLDNRAGQDDEALRWHELVADRREQEYEGAESQRQRVELAFESLPPMLRLVGRWYYYDEKSLDEIAKLLNTYLSKVARLKKRFDQLFVVAYKTLVERGV